MMKPLGLDGMFADLLKQQSLFKNLLGDHFSSSTMITEAFKDAFKIPQLDFGLDSVKTFQENNAFKLQSDLLKIQGLGLANSISSIDFSFGKQLQEIATRLRDNPDYVKEILEESENGNLKAYSLRAIYEYLAEKFPQYLSTHGLVILLLSMAIENRLGKHINELLVQPNLCIARNGCRIRAQGNTHSEIEAVIPHGEEVLVLEDYGHWKKVIWQKNEDEIFEGWIYCSLLEWKYKYVMRK